jgi:hypothetical protein
MPACLVNLQARVISTISLKNVSQYEHKITTANNCLTSRFLPLRTNTVWTRNIYILLLKSILWIRNYLFWIRIQIQLRLFRKFRIRKRDGKVHIEIFYHWFSSLYESTWSCDPYPKFVLKFCQDIRKIGSLTHSQFYQIIMSHCFFHSILHF